MHILKMNFSMRNILAGVLLATTCCLVPASSVAAPTIKQLQELNQIAIELNRVNGMIRTKKYDEAVEFIEESETKFNKLVEEADFPSTNPKVNGLRLRYKQLRQAILRLNAAAMKNQPQDKISFEKDVAPILKSRCLSCHGANRPRGGLRLNTFANIKKGGPSGKLWVTGNANVSPLIRIMTTTDASKRMPKSGTPVAFKDIQTIATWINQGAKYDGVRETVNIGESARENNIQIATATGNEKVSFTEDIAPWFNNLCVRCHRGRNPRGGFNMETFENIMRGGKSGRVVIGGNLEGSRLFRLVGGLENPRMPNDRQVRITRQNYNDLRTWILEGAKYDGDDAKIPLSQLVPDEEQVKAEELARLTDEEFFELREKRTDDLWDRVYQNSEPRWVKSKDFYVYGDVPATRLRQIDNWADEFAQELRKTFNDKSSQMWKGRLAVIVFKDRFGFEEFNISVEKRRVPPSVVGDANVKSDYQDAYIVLQDVGDVTLDGQLNLRMSLIEQLASAYLQRGGGDLPDWVTQGLGLYMVAKANSADETIKSMRSDAFRLVRGLSKPENLFAKGQFSASQTRPVGLTLVEFLIKQGGADRFQKFVERLQQGDSIEAAMKAVYQADYKAVARAFAQGLRSR